VINPAVVADLAPTGVLRASINLGNPVIAQGSGETPPWSPRRREEAGASGRKPVVQPGERFRVAPGPLDDGGVVVWVGRGRRPDSGVAWL
jgi:hypothetical protein